VQTNISKSITADFGDSLSRFGNVTFISADSADELQAQLRSVKIMFSLLAIYSQGSKHYAWINPERKLIKKSRKDINDGSS
jgi:hypothetical protein